MPTATVEHVYRDLEAIYEHYSAPSKEITFEGNTYTFEGSKRVMDKVVHLYRCEQEQHNLKIHLQGNLPYLVEWSYSVESN
ncbi:hypothetical protein [Solibacillus sp. CAU 1738]|uniref:hypothetical protein n=1 Tax=Solibacillus sp. CAU 1738 TaxID=3140363 RepID=UPI00326146B6